MQTLSETRKYQYDYHSKNYPYFNDFKRNPYTFLKARFYMESSAVLVYLSLRMKIKPNAVTIIYGLAGIFGGILLAIPLTVTHIMGIFVFFTKSILDWSDGHLARITNQTSITGHVLDVHGAVLNDLGFQVGLGFYVAFKTQNPIFYYLIPLVPFFYAVKLKTFSQALLFGEALKKEFIFREVKKIKDLIASDQVSKKEEFQTPGKYSKYSQRLSTFLDPRARSVDFICLLILIEMISSTSVTWIIFSAFIVKGFLQFLGGYYSLIKKGWVEETFNSFIYNIKNCLEDAGND